MDAFTPEISVALYLPIDIVACASRRHACPLPHHGEQLRPYREAETVSKTWRRGGNGYPQIFIVETQ